MASPSIPSGSDGAAGSRQALPTGTFLVTDIEGSTQLAQVHPAEWEAARERHGVILRAQAEAHQGYVFQVVGKVSCLAFATEPTRQQPRML